jgi:hypothetical protein
MVEPFAMASLPATPVSISIPTALFVTIAVARPQPCHHLHPLAALTLLVACHPHRHHSRCRRHRPCCCLPRTLILLVACHPHHCHSRCHCHRPHCRLPRTLIVVAIALATVASALSSLATLVAVIIALWVASAFTCPPPSLPAGVILLANQRRWRRRQQWRRRWGADRGGSCGVGNAATK